MCVRTPPTLQRCVRTMIITSRISILPKLCVRTTPKFLDRELVTGWSDSPLPLSPTSVLRPKKLLVLALAVPKPMLPPVNPVQKDLETPIPEIPRVPKMRRTARISVKPVWLQFPKRVIVEKGPSIVATKEKVVIDDSSDSETSKKVEDDNMELIPMDEPFVQVEEVEEEEEEEDPEEDPEEEEEGEVEYFRDEEDYEDYFSEEDDDSSDGSTGNN
ncbi:hypothetical protein PIB30_069653 [Stylosanthes scabra]|uniref:Uncharacterized protein n=1 Tax=Stylosanthes scabra TaxID=79078 RepID=A0ABU6XLK2_9FABA|nr:hypothetical protein [Stylosanthes scabra]